MTHKIKLAVPTHAYYWGEGGQYGPFDVQQTGAWAGWPDFGQVLRYFRVKAEMTMQDFCILYGNEVNGDGHPVSERWILKMELDNKVPVDMNKRKTLARLLSIPPMLFGLASLEDVEIKPQSQTQAAAIGRTTLQRAATDTGKYQNNVRNIWLLHDTSNAQSSLKQINSDILDLESLERQAQGDFLYHVQELLFSYHVLAANVIRDQKQFNAAYTHANEAVRVAKNMNDSDLLATAFYTRGCTSLEWGMFGTIVQGVFQVQRDKISAAARDFERAKEPDIHPQLRGYVLTHLSRAQALLNSSKQESTIAPALTMLEEVEDMIDRQHIDDQYTRVLVTGTRGGFLQGSYHDTRAAAFVSARLPGKALQELKAIEELPGKKLGQDVTRYYAWLDVLSANAFIGLEEYGEATKRAKRALITSSDINSVTNVANIVDIHGHLLKSPYKGNASVQELGDMLKELPVSSTEEIK